MEDISNAVFAQLMNRLSTAMNQLGEPMRAKAYKKAEESILSLFPYTIYVE